MRVLHVIPSLGPARGGPSFAARLMARAGVDAGLSVDVVATNDNDHELLAVPLETPIVQDGVRYRYFQREARPYTISRPLARWLRENVGRFDVVHIHALFSYSTTVAVAAAGRRRVPYILRPLGTLARYGFSQHRWLKQASWRLVERRALARAAAVHFTSEAEREEAERLGGLWHGVVLPLGIDIGAYETHAATAGALDFLFLSRIHPKKQLELVLRALVRIPAASLTVAGSGEQAYVASLQRLANELGIAQRVRWLGQVAGAEKAAVLRAARAFVLPSINENFGVSVVEALASRVPVIVTPGVAIHREIAEAEAGLVVDPTVDALYGAMVSMQNDIQRERMAARARTLAEARFSLSAMASGLAAMYERSARAG